MKRFRVLASIFGASVLALPGCGSLKTGKVPADSPLVEFEPPEEEDLIGDDGDDGDDMGDADDDADADDDGGGEPAGGGGADTGGAAGGGGAVSATGAGSGAAKPRK